jgi:UDP-glucuronate 4-epimerase
MRAGTFKDPEARMDVTLDRLRDAPVLVTGAAGFIGFFLAKRLLALGCRVVGFDNVNAYYDPALKEARLAILAESPGFTFVRADLVDAAAVRAAIATHRPRYVAHMAAQAGVRHSLQHPEDYIASNLVGFFNIIEACRDAGVEHFVYASSSSVYGGNAKQPFSVEDPVDHPLSLYAATKKSNELVAHVYSHLHGLPTTGLRFFTVYGPWGRPDMALFLFTRAILAGEPIRIFNNGEMDRDFTYIDDIAEGVLRTLAHVAAPDPDWRADAPNPGTSASPFAVYNIGNHQPVPLMEMIAVLEDALGQQAIKTFLPMQPGDVPSTYADVDSLARATGFRPSTPITVGIPRFVAWYRAFYGV